MSHYTQHNLSIEARVATRHIFEAFAYTTNIFLFAYIGFVSSSADVFTRAVVVLAVAAVCHAPLSIESIKKAQNTPLLSRISLLACK